MTLSDLLSNMYYLDMSYAVLYPVVAYYHLLSQYIVAFALPFPLASKTLVLDL